MFIYIMFKELNRAFKGLCRPSQLYVSISLVSLFIMILQNLNGNTSYCLGSYSCDLGFPKLFMFLGKAAYVLTWTIILDSLCKNGYTQMSWFFVMVPYILLFVILGMIMFASMIN